jgi:hypothetical protein
MAKKGRYVKSPEWWKHLKWAKRRFWKAERKAAKQQNQDNL